jgi:F0F1-type ATP synthase membrane subunit c/vacuolar-type H+-ATPase subunit K
MSSYIILFLLVIDLALFLAAVLYLDEAEEKTRNQAISNPSAINPETPAKNMAPQAIATNAAAGLATYLAGIAAGSYVSERVTKDSKSPAIMRLIGTMMLVTGGLSVYLTPLVANPSSSLRGSKES